MRIAQFFGLALLAASASAATFDQMVVFGDSLSDTGNASILTNNLFPGPNYAPGRFTDGPSTTPAATGPQGVWVDQLAVKLGVPDPQPNYGGGTNFAVASANTGTGTFIDIGSQVGLYLKGGLSAADPSSLYAIWGGANDLFNGLGGSQAANNLSSNIQTLAAAGAKSFLWLNLPPLADTPVAKAARPLAAQTTAFNQTWSSDLTTLQASGINVVGVDINSLFTTIAQSPGSFGFQNITDPAQGQSVNPNTYLFWDTQHPTTAGHAYVADLAFSGLTATSTPEPASYALAFTGLAGVLVTVIRRRSVSR